jgi:phage terminase large subunit
MEVAPLFEKIENCDKKIIVLQGGGDAGKTVTALQYLAKQATQEKGVTITVTAQDGPNLKKGALRSFQKYVQPYFGQYIKSFNKTEGAYTWHNGSIMEFSGFKDEMDARGSERDYLFINEANSRTYEFFWQLQRKTRKKVILDYNPTSEFWAHNKLLNGEERQFIGKVQLFIVDHRHNPFLTDEEHEAYESISDPDMFKVYSRGKKGKIKGLIFGHFKKIQLHELPTVYDRIVFGEDYGFTNDPTAIVKMFVVGRKRYFQKLSYTPGLSPDHLIQIKKDNGWKEGINVFGDTGRNMHDGGVSMINQQRMKGMPVMPAIKGIAVGIAKVKEYECFYVDDEDFNTEIGTYKWVMALDALTGKEVMTNIPVDAHNHICDASRYACYTDSIRHR